VNSTWWRARLDQLAALLREEDLIRTREFRRAHSPRSPADRPEPAGAAELIVVDAELAHPPARVWSALTEPALLAAWLLRAEDFVPVAGRWFTVTARPSLVAELTGVDRGCVLAVRPQRLLRTSWQSAAPGARSVLTWRLAPATDGPAGTRLRLEHGEFQLISGAARRQVAAGWQRAVPHHLDAALVRAGRG
jgi:uncharacterized protein YndB with AHSA1/START domain